MAVEIVLPRLGWTMEEGTFVEWLKKDGDEVAPGDLIYVVETDKTTSEVENFDAGILRILPNGPKAGQTMPVGTLLAYVVKPGEKPPFETGGAPAAAAPAPPAASPAVAAAPAPAPAPAEAAVNGKRHTASPRARRAAAALGVALTGLAGTGATGRILERDVQAAAARKGEEPKVNASPIAIRVARELGVDLAAVAAASAGGRIERADVERFAAAQKTPAAPAPATPPATSGASREKMTGTRKLIAERMSAVMRTVAPVTLTTEVDATELVKLREALKEQAGAEAPSYNDLLIKISAVALADHPRMNARIEGDEIVTEAAAHVGLAVDTDRGLLVMVVRDAGARTVRQISTETRRLVAKARDGKASVDDLRGSTFSITNLGVYDIDAFTPIINAPECAILGVGRIVAKPVIVGKRVRTRQRVALSLTFDHRLVDGAPAARFLQRIKQLIEQPYLWLAA